MALNTQIVSIKLGQGIDTKTSEPWTLPTSFSSLENGIVQKNGELRKRSGYAELPQEQRFVSASGIFTYNDELLVSADDRVFSYSSASQDFVAKGAYTPCNVQTTSIIHNEFSQAKVDAAQLNSVMALVWEDSRGGIRYTLRDTTLGTVLANDLVLTPTGRSPRIEAMGNNFFVWCVSGNTGSVNNNLCAYRLHPLTGVVQSFVTASTEVSGSGHFDIANDTFAYHASDDHVVVGQYTSAPIVAATVDLSISHVKALSLIDNRTFIYHSGSVVNRLDMDNAYDIVSSSVIGSGSYTNLAGSSQYVVADNQDGITCFVSGSQSMIRGDVSLASRPFGNSVIGVHVSDFQPIHFVVSLANGNIQAKTNVLSAGNAITGSLPTPIYLNNAWQIPTEVRTAQLLDINGTSTIRTGINLQSITFNPSLQRVPMGRHQHVAGGLVSCYDGVSMQEVGFALFPENIQVASGSGGSLQSGSYLYQVTYESYDAQGQRHQSAPSVAERVVLPSGSTAVTLTIPTLKLSNRENVSIVVWRSVDNVDSVLYRISNESLANDPTADTVSVTDSTDDATLSQHEVLYTAGNTLENISPPPATLIASFNTRVFLAGLPNSTQLWYSKQLVEGQPVSFSDSLTIQVEAAGGPITALASMLDRLLIFKRDRIYYLTGEGSTNTGQGIAYSAPQLFTSDVGCINPASVVLTPKGIMFQSAKGIYLVANTTVTYIGAPVEDFNSLNITRAVLLEDANEVRFISDTGICLVYNYYNDLWTTFTQHFGVDASVWRSSYVYYHALRNGLFVANPALFTDSGQEYSLSATTAWIRIGDIQGYQRAKRFAVLAQYRSPHVFICEVGYDLSPIYSQLVAFDPDQLGFSIYGRGYYGEVSPYGGSSDGVYEFRGHIVKQKCAVLRFRFTERYSTETGESLRLQALSLECGIKKGIKKLGATQSV